MFSRGNTNRNKYVPFTHIRNLIVHYSKMWRVSDKRTQNRAQHEIYFWNRSSESLIQIFWFFAFYSVITYHFVGKPLSENVLITIRSRLTWLSTTFFVKVCLKVSQDCKHTLRLNLLIITRFIVYWVCRENSIFCSYDIDSLNSEEVHI